MSVRYAIDYPDESINNLLRPPNYRNIHLILVSVMLLPVILWSSTTEYAAYVPLAIIILFVGAISFRSPIAALSIIILFHIVILEPTEGISFGEAAFGLYFFGYMGFWFFNKIFLQREKFLLALPDILLISYVTMCFLSIVMVLVVNTSILKWFREFLTVASLLLYFPAREALRSKRNVKIATAAFLIVALTFALKNIWHYRTASLAASYLWELLGSRKPLSTHLFFGSSIVLASLFIHTRSLKYRLTFGFCTLIMLLALLVSFARGFWIATLIGFVVLVVMIDAHKRKMFFLVSVIGVCGAVLLISLFYPHTSSFIFQTIVHRFASSGNAFQDISVVERVAESQAALNEIAQSPLVGHGFGATFSFYNLLEHNTVTTWYTHNAYIFLLFKVGVIGTFLFLGFFFGVVYKGIRAVDNLSDSVFRKGIYRGIVAVFISLLAVAVTSNMFIEKESLLIISLGAAIIMSSYGIGIEGFD